LGVSAEQSAYLARANQTKQTTGMRYEMFASEERRKREEEERIRRARGGVEFYAPERRIEEFYAGAGRNE
jgi:hypothetical protein